MRKKPAPTEPEQAQGDKEFMDYVVYAKTRGEFLEEEHLGILDDVKATSKRIAENKVKDYVKSLANVEGFTDEHKQVIATWYHRITALPGSKDWTAILRQCAAKLGVKKDGSRKTLERTLLKVPGL